jgi:hypothetical protein
VPSEPLGFGNHAVGVIEAAEGSKRFGRRLAVDLERGDID